jgi:hypothetical protein
MLAGLPVDAADGMLVNLADTPANRKFFGSTGTADDSSPFPQVRVVAPTARAGRAMLGAVLGQAGTGEQTLLKRLVRRQPGLFAGRVTCSDRNFPGYNLVTAILDAGGQVVARALRRKDTAPVTADEESFTAARHHVIRSTATSQVTASSSLDALAAAADASAAAILNVPARQRHSKRAQKARPKFPHASATKQSFTGKPQVIVFAPGFP